MLRKLGIFERAQLIADTHSPFHILGVLRLENAPSPDVVQQALRNLQKRHPFLSACLSQDRESYEHLETPSLPFVLIPRTSDTQWVQLAENDLVTRIDAQNAPMFRCTYLYNESHSNAELLFAISHFIADAASSSHLLHELMTICASLMDGESVSPPKLLPAPTLESGFPPVYQGWKMSLRIMRYSFVQMGDEIAYRLRTIGTRKLRVPPPSSRGHILTLQVAENIFEAFAHRARKEGVTLNSALNAALLLSVNRHLYAGKKLPMRTFSFADLRPHVQPPVPAMNLGLYISMMRFTVDVDGDMDLWPLAKSLHKKIYATLRSGDKFVAAAMSESLLKMLTSVKTLRLCASTLNYTGTVFVQPQYRNIKVTDVHGLVSPFGFGPEMASQAQVFNNHLTWDFMYFDADMNQTIAETIVREVEGILQSFSG